MEPKKFILRPIFLDTDGGIMVTASHNPADYNGMKIVGSGARPISMDSGLQEIKGLAEQLSSKISGNSSPAAHKKY